MGVFSSWVTAFRKLSCCSLRRTSRTKKMVFRITPAMMNPKNRTPRKRGTTSRQLRTIQLMLSASATAATSTPSVTAKAIVRFRLVMRMVLLVKDSTAIKEDGAGGAAGTRLHQRGEAFDFALSKRGIGLVATRLGVPQR